MQPERKFAVESWKCWEHSLIRSRTYDNPVLNVTLSVRYTSPAGKRYDCYGFWDGDKTYRIRFMFNQIGEWSWRTTCSDTSNRGLHAISGSLEVSWYRPTQGVFCDNFPPTVENSGSVTFTKPEGWEDAVVPWHIGYFIA